MQRSIDAEHAWHTKSADTVVNASTGDTLAFGTQSSQVDRAWLAADLPELIGRRRWHLGIPGNIKPQPAAAVNRL